MASTADDAFAQSFSRSLRISGQGQEADATLLIRSASAPAIGENANSFVNRSATSGYAAAEKYESREGMGHHAGQSIHGPYASGFYGVQQHQSSSAATVAAQHQAQLQQQQLHNQHQQQQAASGMYGYHHSPGLHPMGAPLFDFSSSPYLGPASTGAFTQANQQFTASPGLGPYTPNLLPQSLFGTPTFLAQPISQVQQDAVYQVTYSPALSPAAYYTVPSMNAQQSWMYATQSPPIVPQQMPPPLQMPMIQQLPPSAMGSQTATSPEPVRCLRSESTPSVVPTGEVWGSSDASSSMIGGGGASGQIKKGSLLEELRKMKASPTNQQRTGGSVDPNKHMYGHPAPINTSFGQGPAPGTGGPHRGGKSVKSPTNGVPWGLRDILGQVNEFAKDQHGSRFIQQQLESPTVSAEDKQALFEEVLPFARMLCIDVFGNYVFQKLLDPQVGTPAQQEQLCLAALQGNMLELSMHMYGCRVVQKLVEKVFGEEGQELRRHFDAVENRELPGARLYNPTFQDSLLQELNGSILRCVQDQNGNHVLQKCIEQVRPLERISFILDAFKGNIASMARHAYGCRVVQRILENCDEVRIREALSELIAEIDELVVDSFGNYVVQHVIESRNQEKQAEERRRVLDAVNRNVLSYSTHKFASNVVEKCLQHGDAKERRALIDKMLERSEGRRNCPLVPMMKDPYANYVVQKVIDRAEPDQREKVVQLVRENAQALKRLTYGKHILARLDKITNTGDSFPSKKRA